MRMCSSVAITSDTRIGFDYDAGRAPVRQSVGTVFDPSTRDRNMQNKRGNFRNFHLDFHSGFRSDYYFHRYHRYRQVDGPLLQS